MCVVDPHGELVEKILEKVPQSRINDVIYFNPADPEFNIGFNPLELPDPKYKNLVASGLMAIFTKIWQNVWSARMEYILNNAILALLDTPKSTLLGISRILTDKDFRQQIIGNIKDPVVKAFWVNEFEQWKDQFRMEAIAPIQNKVGQFLSTSMIRNIVGQSRSTIDIFDIMNQGKIFLINVSKGRIGEDNAALLGAMIITKVQLSAMERVRIPEDERKDFFLYVDEFQNFATDSFASILSEARKYRLNLTIAHQYIGQLVTDVSTKVRDAVFGNCGTMIIFRVGATDAEVLEKEFEPEFTAQDLINLPNHQIYIKLMVNGVTSRPFSASTLDYFKMNADPDAVKKIYEITQKNYARPRQRVEEEINRWSGMLGGEESEESGGEVRSGRSQVRVGDAIKYKAQCVLCGKDALLPFEPEEGRPVYCNECMAKIKAGELEPVRVNRKEVEIAKARSGHFFELSKLGIEFEHKEPAREPGRPPREREVRSRPSPAVVGRAGEERRNIRRDHEVPRGEQQERKQEATLSLSELKPREDKQKGPIKQKKEPNIDELRKAIQSALEKESTAE